MGDGNAPLIFIVSGPGGVGKGTIVGLLVEQDQQLWLSRSWTTRDRRPGEAADAYTFTDRRLITRTGVLTRRGHDIPLSRISDVASELGLVDRMLGCGTLIISDASTHGSVRLPDIPHVEDTQRRLNLLLSELEHSGHDGR